MKLYDYRDEQARLANADWTESFNVDVVDMAQDNQARPTLMSHVVSWIVKDLAAVYCVWVSYI